MRSFLALTAALLLAGHPAAADTTAGAALGVGAFDARAMTSLDLALDVSHDEVSAGLGGRLRLIADDGWREEDWDETSEFGPPPKRRIPRARFLRDARKAGLRLVGEKSFLPHQYFLELRRR